jgi:hypothetical protein
MIAIRGGGAKEIVKLPLDLRGPSGRRSPIAVVRNAWLAIGDAGRAANYPYPTPGAPGHRRGLRSRSVALRVDVGRLR